MVIHHARVIKGMFGGTRTSTECGRMNKESLDGMNSSGVESEVTCKFCLRQMKARAERHTREAESCARLSVGGK